MTRPGARKRPTQAEIAQLAGVSQATVSLVLNGRDHELSATTRERVREAIQRWGYVANPMARSLAGGRNRILGVHTFEQVFPLEGGNFYFPFLVGVEQEAERQGYDLLMFTSGGRGRRIFQDGATRLQLADGAVLLGRNTNLDEVEKLREMDYPFVYIGHREVPGRRISYVAANYGAATESVVNRLLGLGHRRLAYLRVGDGVDQPSLDRIEGFRAAVRAAQLGGPATPVWNVDQPSDIAGVLDEVDAAGVTALLVEQQQLAENLREACRERGVTVPDELSIAVLGDTIGARGPDQPWSGFRVPRREMGAAATALLIEQLDGTVTGPQIRSVDCPLVDGGTVAAPAARPGSGHHLTSEETA